MYYTEFPNYGDASHDLPCDAFLLDFPSLRIHVQPGQLSIMLMAASSALTHEPSVSRPQRRWPGAVRPWPHHIAIVGGRGGPGEASEDASRIRAKPRRRWCRGGLKSVPWPRSRRRDIWERPTTPCDSCQSCLPHPTTCWSHEAAPFGHWCVSTHPCRCHWCLTTPAPTPDCSGVMRPWGHLWDGS